MTKHYRWIWAVAWLSLAVRGWLELLQGRTSSGVTAMLIAGFWLVLAPLLQRPRSRLAMLLLCAVAVLALVLMIEEFSDFFLSG